MILQEEYNLNLASQLSKKHVKVSQYDTGRRLLITLIKNDGSMFKIPSEASASINGLKPDGNGFRYDCSIENNKVVVDMKEQMTVLAGCVKCEILLSKGGERIATANFMLSVEESPLSENTPISSTDIPLLQKAIEASEIVLSVEKTVKGYSESASKSAQSSQASAESAVNASNASAESANSASQSAKNASTKATEAKKSETNAKQSETNASNSAKKAQASADSAIQTKAEIEQLKKETIEQASTLTDSAKQEISTVKDATVAEVTELKNSTVSEITTLKDNTIEAVTLLKDNAKAEADRATESSASAKVQAEKAKASADSIANVTSDVEKLKEDLPNKITKFYASNQGEIHITDSDNGKIQDMMIYGKSSQDGTPSLENPVEIKNVVNPKISVCGSNIFQLDEKRLIRNAFEGNVTINDGFLSYEGSILRKFASIYIENISLKKGKYQLLANQYSSANNIGAKLIIEKASGTTYIMNNIPFTIDGDEIKCRMLISTEDAGTYPLSVSGKVKVALVYSGSTTDIQTYIGQSVTLPVALNAIPVFSGGNVTIDGKQYIADYIDVERGKVVRMTNNKEVNGLLFKYEKTPNNKSDTFIHTLDLLESGTYTGVSLCKYMLFEGVAYDIEMSIDARCYVWKNSLTVQFKASVGIDSIDKFTKWLETNSDMSILYILATPIEEDLTVEQVQKLKALKTYYPTTNITTNSEQLDGYTVFNYPISMANGWNYVKQQLNDNRDYIYDMDLQSAEAYVNSEYAVTLTELEI